MRATRALLVIAGLAMMCFAAVGIVTSPDTNLIRLGLFLVGTVLLHDALLAPLFIGAGFVAGRVVRPQYLPVVQGALIVTAAVTFVALPFLLGFGRTHDVPSALPRNYLGGYAIVLGLTCLAAAAAIIWRRRYPKWTNGSDGNKASH